MPAIWRDIRYALRTMRKQLGFTAAAVISLALAIGGTTAMFTVIRAVLLKPLAYADPGRLVEIEGGATPTRFFEMRAAAQSFSGIGAFAGLDDVTLAGAAEPEVIHAAPVSAGFLRILGVNPVLGRDFRPEEDSAGGAPVAMISAELWRRRFGNDPHIIGRIAVLSDAPYTIIAVLPPHFRFPYAGVDIWITAPTELPGIPAKSRALSPYLNLFGRLKPGVSLAQANAELKVIRTQYAHAHPAMLDAKPASPEVSLLKEHMVSSVRTMLWMLFGAAAFVLMIACANIAGLLLARSAARAREFAVRAALGAARAQLMRLLMAESILLSATGGALGVALAAYLLRGIPTMTAFQMPRASEVHLDWFVLIFAAAISIFTGALFGSAPSLDASRPDLMGALRTSGMMASAAVPRARASLRSFLLVGQIALATVLLIGAALLMRSVARLRGVDTGFNATNLLTLNISLPPVRYNDNQKLAAFFGQLVDGVKSLPGVRGAAATWILPMMGSPGTPVQDASQAPLPLNQRLIATLLVVSPRYFQTLGIPLQRGRDFTEQDKQDTQRVAIIDESLARRLWPAYPTGRNPIGQRLWIGGVNPRAAEIVGIAANVHQQLEGNVWPESVYEAFAQNPKQSAALAIRTAGDPLALTRAVREQVRSIDRDQAISYVRTMEDLIEEEVGERRLLTILLGSFAGVALLLAMIGTYGVVAYSVAQRTQELGIRRALGAQHRDILSLVIRQGLVLALAGVVIGLAGAYALTGLLRAVLFHVSTTDPAIFGGIAILFLVVSLAASYIPARRAARIDPMAALRT